MDDVFIKSNFFKNLAKMAKNGEIFSPVQTERVASMANFLLKSIKKYKTNNREYFAIMLGNEFYGNESLAGIEPHLEIPEKIIKLNNHDNFTQIFSNMGNSVFSGKITYAELKAIKKLLFNTDFDNGYALINEIESVKLSIKKNIDRIKTDLEGNWALLEDLMYSKEGIELISDFSSKDINEKLPQLAKSIDRISFSDSLRHSRNNPHRSIGVWRIDYKNSSIVAVTPRLTKNSLIYDKNYSTDTEGSLAILVEFLLLERIVNKLLNKKYFATTTSKTTFYVVSRKKGKVIPTPTSEMVYSMVKTFSNAGDCWDLLFDTISKYGNYSTDKELFYKNFNKQRDKISKHEDVTIEDVDSLLPIVLLENGEFGRLLFKVKG